MDNSIFCTRLPQDQATSTREVKEVAKFMEFMLGDCSGDEDSTFLTLRVYVTSNKTLYPSKCQYMININDSLLTRVFVVQVIGVMGKYMEGFPSLKSSLLNCMGQTYASLPVQKAAIQAFRLMEMNSDVNQLLLRFTTFI